ncbi:MAG TPA: hypothetical protein VFU21_31765 [Kofleriaceae bacterium]|nr:hypothetical protein [Kofleriaceae bacterium]
MEWQTLGALPPSLLSDTRVELHWAAQVLCACADRWIEPRADDSHTAMTWDPAAGVLVGEEVAGGARLALRVPDLTLVAPAGELPLGGRSLEEALAWADRQLASASGEQPRGVRPRDRDMPPHPVAQGARFAPDPAALAELARWYTDGDHLLRDLAAREPGATAVRCWPHHFDIALVIYLDSGAPRATARQMGVGLSPGDRHHPEPYFYVSPSPIEVDVTFPPLPSGGRWQRSGFTGAILLASDLLQGAPGGQPDRVRAWLDAALATGRHLVSASR